LPSSSGATVSDVGFDRAGAEERFAEPNQALVGVDVQPEQVGELAQADRLETGDLHAGVLLDGRRDPSSLSGSGYRRAGHRAMLQV
jgi:hypothetical protein